MEELKEALKAAIAKAKEQQAVYEELIEAYDAKFHNAQTAGEKSAIKEEIYGYMDAVSFIQKMIKQAQDSLDDIN